MKYIDVLVGSYGAPQDEGLQVLRFDVISRTLEKVSALRGVENPSFVTVDSNGRQAYAVSETESGSVVALAIDTDSHALSEVNRLSTGGWAPCHLSRDESRGWLHVVNYMSGEVCRFSVAKDGYGLSQLIDIVKHEGGGPHRDRQQSAHPHSVWNWPRQDSEGLNADRIVVADLGMDALVVYDSSSEKLRRVEEMRSTPGNGPRHVEFHPSGRWMYVLNELGSSISVYLLGATRIGSCVQEISTLPPDYMESHNNTAADIHLHPSGKYLYASNRGHNSIVTYTLRPDGTLDVAGHTLTGGSTPRNFAVLPGGEAILVANQNSNDIVVMYVTQSGQPVPTGTAYPISHPTCIQVLPIPACAER